jgi:hypothetical protein
LEHQKHIAPFQFDDVEASLAPPGVLSNKRHGILVPAYILKHKHCYYKTLRITKRKINTMHIPHTIPPGVASNLSEADVPTSFAHEASTSL